MSEALFIRALDAPMPFDFEHKAKNIIAKRKQLRIGIVGFGTFGQFLAGRLVAAGHQVSARQETHDHSIAASRRYKHGSSCVCLHKFAVGTGRPLLSPSTARLLCIKPHLLLDSHAGLSNIQDRLC